MKHAYQSISIHDIPQEILFEGYYWYSNEKSPTVISQEAIQQSWFTDLPFVIEANFYTKAENISIQVRHIDGAYSAAKIDLNQLEEIEYDKTTYIGHDLGVGGRDFIMIEAWALHKDELLEDMETLVPAWEAFAGFTTKK